MMNGKSCDCWQEIKWLKSAVENLQYKVELQYQLIQDMKENKTKPQLPLITNFPDLNQSKLFTEQSDSGPMKKLFGDEESLVETLKIPDETASPNHSSVLTNSSQFKNGLVQHSEGNAEEKENDGLTFNANNVENVAITKVLTTSNPISKDLCESTATNIHSESTQNCKTKLQLATKLFRKHNNPIKPILNCDQCEKVYTSKQGLDIHVNVVHKSIRYACKYCSVSFRTYSGLRYNVKCTHAKKDCLGGDLIKEKMIVCQFCDEKFNQLQGLRIHLVKMHPEKTNIICRICKKKFPRKKYCNRHVLKCGFK